jgi:PAS domain S-box-containing protein
MKDQESHSKKEFLREKAEEILKNKPISIDTLCLQGETLKLIHELDVHQIELEMQNEELRLAKEQVEIAAEKYIDLYDFAPSGYFTLSTNGEIHKLNFKAADMLGKERSFLLNNRFGFFVTPESKLIFSSFLDRIFESKTKETCEITLAVDPEKPTYLLLNGITANEEDHCLITAVDISKLKKTEIALKKSELLLHSSIDSQKDSLIFSIDADYNYLTFNKAHCEAMKSIYNSDIKIGVNILECIASIEDRNSAKENYDRALGGESHSNIRRLGSNESAYYESFFYPIISTSKIVGVSCLFRNITARLQIEETVKENEEKYRTLFDSNRDGISIFRLNSEGKAENFIEANAATTEIYGFTKEELMQMNPKDLDPVGIKIRKERIATLIAKGRLDFETIIKTKKGKSRNVEVELLIINYLNEPAVMNITRDITERKQIELNAKKAQENLLTILEAIPDLLFEVDQNGLIHHYQSHRIDLLAASPEVFMGKLFKDVLPAEAANVCMDAIDEASKNGWSSGKQYSLDLANGKHWFELSVSTIKESDPKERHFIILARDITERKMSEIALRENEEKLQGIFHVANSGIIMTDTTGKFLLFNDWCCEMLGYTREEFSHLNSAIVTYPDDYEQSKLFMKKLFSGKIDKYQIEKRYLRKDKSFIWCELSASSIKDENNNVVNIIGIILDITERKKIENELYESERFSHATFDALSAHIAILDENGIILSVNLAWRRFMEANTPKGTPITISEGTNYLAICETSEGLCTDESAEMIAGIRSVMSGEKNEFSLEYPCHSPTEKKWFVARVTRFPQEGDLRIVVAHENITERKVAEEKILLSQRRFKSIIDSSPVGMGINDEHQNISYLNRSFVTMFGYTLKDIKTTQDWYEKAYPDPDYRKKITDYWIAEVEKVKQTGEKFTSLEAIIRCKNGLDKTVMISASPIPSSEQQEYLVNFYDITKRKKAEKAKEDTLKLVQEITSLVPGVVYQYKLRPDGTSCFPYASKGIQQIYGVKPEEVREDASKVFSRIHPDDLAKVTASIQESAKNLTSWTKEYRTKFDDGTERTLYGNAIPIREEDGSILWHGFISDVTEKKLAEKSSRESDEKIRNLLDTTDGIIWEADAQTFNFTFVSKQAERLLGFSVEEWYGEGFWKKQIHPDDRERTIAFCVTRTKLMEAHDFIYRFITKSGKVVWLRDIVKVIIRDGKPSHLQGVMFDITTQKRVEESLRESEEKYRGLVENSPDAVAIYAEGKIVFINDECIRMVGAKSKEDILGKPVLQFVHPDSVASIIERMEEVILDHTASPLVEEKFIDLAGNPIDIEIKGIPTIFEHKAAVQVIIHDITKRKQSLVELNKMNRVYSLISQINNLILRSKNREELLQEICRIAVTFGKFRMSWIGMLDEDGKTVNVASFYGVEEGYFSKDNEITILDEPRGNGPTGTAMREGRTVISNNIETDRSMDLWHKKAKVRGYRSSISIPIVVLDKIIGSFNLYSEDTNSFSSEEEIDLLEKITQNIAFTLESILFEEDRIKTQEKIKQLSQAVEQSPVTIVITNTKGNIEYVNQKFVESTGYSLEEVIGKNPRILKSGHTSPDEYKILWKTLLAGNEWHGEFHNVKKDGGLFWESASISPILNVKGKTTHYIAIKEDITARKKVEKELIKAKEKAEESDRLKLAFLANMSHEIRTPMNGILGFTELLKSPNLAGEEQQEYIRIIEKSGVRMLNIINDIINISKVESGQIEISLSETNLNEQIEYLHTFFKPEALQKGLLLSVTKKLDVKDSIVTTDKEKVYAILTNLVKNAVKFTDSGFIEFGCSKKGNFLEFYIKDSGFGISNSQKKIIFERFRRGNETITRTHEGSGLGLAISKAYVEMLGGKIWVESEQGKGSTFYFTIPANTELKSLEKVPSKAKSALEEKEENQIKDLKVLIVEDDEISKLLITIAVKKFSKEILKVGTGLEAIEACRNNPDIDLVMMDINMPEMGGYEATEQIRKFNKDVVIIAQTANGMQSDRDEAIAAGCTDYISKPVNIASLSALIYKYFKS